MSTSSAQTACRRVVELPAVQPVVLVDLEARRERAAVRRHQGRQDGQLDDGAVDAGELQRPPGGLPADPRSGLRAVYPDARTPFAHPTLYREQNLAAWEVPEIWLITGPTPSHFIDVTDVFPRKLAALRLHTSQTAHLAELAELLVRWQGEHAARGGLPAGRRAEAFQVVRLG
ncbi:hypothetical protein ACFC1R_26860 [Kitasatospora sp. NPDC056138]|uniref:hypothetical protein n=1 Tax=Kitasatospora sp. NPDC056138 TaxID=3345724 RepID=UPI0035DC2861